MSISVCRRRLVNSKLPAEITTSAFKRWHRRMGIASALFILLLAVTGLLLNHTHDWGLDSATITAPRLLSWYGIKQPDELKSYALGEHFVSQVGDEVFVGTREIAHCGAEIKGAIKLPNPELLVIACENDLLLLTASLELVERLGGAHAVPAPIRRLGLLNETLIVATDRANFRADLDHLQWRPFDPPTGSNSVNAEAHEERTIRWSEAVKTPAALQDILPKHFVGEGVSIERLLLDIHSGRIVGAWGIYLVDIMALVFTLLALTGIVLWWRQSTSKN